MKQSDEPKEPSEASGSSGLTVPKLLVGAAACSVLIGVCSGLAYGVHVTRAAQQSHTLAQQEPAPLSDARLSDARLQSAVRDALAQAAEARTVAGKAVATAQATARDAATRDAAMATAAANLAAQNARARVNVVRTDRDTADSALSTAQTGVTSSQALVKKMQTISASAHDRLDAAEQHRQQVAGTRSLLLPADPNQMAQADRAVADAQTATKVADDNLALAKAMAARARDSREQAKTDATTQAKHLDTAAADAAAAQQAARAAARPNKTDTP